MPDNNDSIEAASTEHQLAKSAPQSSPPPTEDQGPSSAGEQEEEELEGYEPSRNPARSLSLTPDARSRQSKTTEKSSPDETSDRWQGESPSSICLCQPDPKVPRPRNAFILYRQHNQAAVAQQNPGLANPEISKIIGDHWRNLSTEDKNHWKLLAEEERIRHQKLYPDYRYQPRRSGRNNSVTTGSQPSSTEVSPRKCPKCGGHSIATSSIMSSSINMNPALSAEYSPNSKAISTPSTGPNSGRFLQRLNLNTPAISNPPPGHRTHPSTTGGAPPLRLVSPPYGRRQGQEDRESSPRFKRPNNGRPFLRSPDSKRRRLATNNATYAPSYPPVRAANGPATPFPFTAGGHNRRQSLPRPDFMGPGLTSPLTMGPPPRPHNPSHHGLPTTPLTLAPIQTPPHPDKMELDTQEKSLEAMILSIPTLGKIKVLAKISPPLAPPGPTSPARQTRGLVIAIDASDPTAIKQLTTTLTTSLADFSPRIFATPTPPADAPPSFQAYLRLIDQYHTLSQQVISHITTLPPSSPLPAKPSSTDANSPSPISPKSFPKQKPSNTPSSSSSSLPIAIIPAFQVTHSDWFASHVAISDAYSPMDHWQWGATLWRNVIGADITVAVQSPASLPDEPPLGVKTPAAVVGKVDSGERKKTSTAGGGGGGAGVDVRLEECRAVVVRGAEGGGVPDGGLRRVGFEIGEWVRGWDGGEGGRRGSALG